MLAARLAAVAVAASALFAAGGAQAVVLVQTSDPGFYNNSIGTVLNGTDEAYFPVSDDSAHVFGPSEAPDLSAASSVLGGWLNQPTPDLSNGFWTANPIAIPNNWAVNTEVAVVYVFNSGGITGLQGSFGVDNGIYVWLDGVFKGGARQGGGVSLGEHVFELGDLSAGTHYLQLLLEDHGSTNGYAVQISADTFIQPPPPSVPAPGALGLFGFGLLGAGLLRRRG